MEAKEQGERIVEKYIETSHEKSFAMFKYLANMFMLMNGVAAISLLNKDPKMFKYAIIAFSTGCLISSILYVFAYASLSDVFICNDSKNRIRSAYKSYKTFTLCTVISFLSSAILFYSGIVLAM